ncbi:MAG: DUF5519 family protein [Drouetiella hepatica Uher 2000/2452]|uniref:DUF5519 family protein n=1 Tax=Drouetiella hepatica Uher 2000/2452 TaxID=904376 RepID=A0A951UPD7_9CYAN|nr:DUF5519 family protein [Drouetiella hepatica Uher 2000/2452]
MTMKTISQAIADTVSTWEGVTISPHRFGGIEFRVDKREVGHLHGNYQADIPFSSRLRRELVAAGKASLHHLYPNSGWVSFYIHSADDVPALIELLRLNYDRLTAHRTPVMAA